MAIFIKLLIQILYLSINFKMSKLLRAMDMFSTSQFTLYRTKQFYGTATGGFVSLLIIGGLLFIFVNMAIDTLRYANIFISSQSIIDSNPVSYKLTTGHANKFMFAIGVAAGMTKDVPYFNIKLENYTVRNANQQFTVQNQSQHLQLCNFTDWDGISAQISSQFATLNLQYFLCPSSGLQLEIQGKNLQETFKYIKLSLWNCTEYYQTGSEKNCAMGGILDDSLNNIRPAFTLFYVSSVPNPNNLTAVSYFIEDANSFILDFDTTFSVSIDLTEYSLTTDESIFPWVSNTVIRGLTALSSASIQSFSKNDNMFGEINIRKSNQRLIIKRSFEKISQILSFVGGLLGPLLLGFSFLKYFSRIAYEIEFGDRIFKHKNTETFASEAFGFTEFLKFMVYSVVRRFGIGKSWENIKKYYKCRTQSIKQLDIHLLFRKIQLFEEVCNVVLDEHHIIGLQILSKKTLKESKKERKRYMLQSLIYGSVQKLSGFINIEEGDYAVNKEKMLQLYQDDIYGQDVTESKKEKIQYQKELMDSYKKLEEQSERGGKYSVKIMRKLRPQESIQIVEDQEMKGDLPLGSDKQMGAGSEVIIVSQTQSL